MIILGVDKKTFLQIDEEFIWSYLAKEVLAENIRRLKEIIRVLNSL